VVFIKTMQFINPDIDYQDAAAAYDDYFTPLIARAAKEWPAAPRRHGPAPRCSSPDPRSPYRRLAIRSREPRPGSSYRGARRNRIIREEKGGINAQLAPRGVTTTRGFFFCAPQSHKARLGLAD
jgi:hypothetical protein